MTTPLHFVPNSILRETDVVDREPVAELPEIEDYFKWGYEQAELLRAGRFDAIDLPNIIDEIEAVARSELHGFRSNLRIILTHILKWEHQPTKRTRFWENSIGEHRDRVEENLADSASMAKKRDEVVAAAYQQARRQASRETRLPIGLFPETCPYSWDDIMKAPYERDPS